MQVLKTLDFVNSTKIINLPDGTNPQDAVTVAQLNAAIEGLAQKDSVRVATQSNISLASPGATIDGITMSSGDRVLVRSQSSAPENGIYIWNGAATPMTRSLDANTSNELESAIVPVEEGTSGGVVYRQTSVNFTLGSGNVSWIVFGSSAGAASESSAGIAEIATQAEVDAGSDDLRIVTPLKLATSPFASKKFNQTIGDGSATSYVVTHNLGTRDVTVFIYRNSGSFDQVLTQVDITSINSVTVSFDTAPTLNAFRVVVKV